MTSGSDSNTSCSGSFHHHDPPAASSQHPIHLTYLHGLQANDLDRAGTSTHPYYSPQTASSSGNASYYNHLWQSGWPSVGVYGYPGNYQVPQQGSFVQPQLQNVISDVALPVHTPASAPQANIPTRPKSPMLSPSPPPPESFRHWDEVIMLFLTRLGLTQAAAGFKADILIMNPAWEQKKVPDAVTELSKNISVSVLLFSRMHISKHIYVSCWENSRIIRTTRLICQKDR